MTTEEPPGRGGPGNEHPVQRRSRWQRPTFNFDSLRQLLRPRRREEPAPVEGDMLSPMILQTERQRLAEVREQLVALEEAMRTQSQEAEEEIQRLNDLVDTLRAKIATMEGDKQTREVVEFQSTLRIMEERRIKVEREYEVRITEIKATYTNKIAEQKVLLDTTMQSLEIRIEELHKSQDLYSEAAELLMNAREEVVEYKARNEELERNLSELKKQLDIANGNNDELKDEIKGLRKEIKKLIRIIEDKVRYFFSVFLYFCIFVFLIFFAF